MLTKIASANRRESGGKFAIVAAKYNPIYTDALVTHAVEELKEAKAQVEVVRVPGSFEVPVVAAQLARSGQFDGVICFGAILRGKTSHAQNIADAVSVALAALQVETGVPVIHGVLLFENEAQARVRCLEAEHNRGIEAARVALEMRTVMRDVNSRLDRGKRSRK